MGLAATAVINYDVKTRESKGVSICPGPNMAYFSQELSLSEMISHIYNDVQGVVRVDRPNIFINELTMYLKYLSDKIEAHKNDWGRKSEQQLNSFVNNMNNGISYYKQMFNSLGDTFAETKDSVRGSLNEAIKKMQKMGDDISCLIEKNQS